MRAPFRPYYARTVLVNLDTGDAFRGVLWDDTRGLLVLRDAEYHGGGQARTVDGEVVVQHSRISYVQVLG